MNKSLNQLSHPYHLSDGSPSARFVPLQFNASLFAFPATDSPASATQWQVLRSSRSLGYSRRILAQTAAHLVFAAAFMPREIRNSAAFLLFSARHNGSNFRLPSFLISDHS